MTILGLLRMRSHQQENGITGRQKWVLVTMGSALMVIGAITSLTPALYPLLAMSKGQQLWEYALVIISFISGRLYLCRYEKNAMSLANPKLFAVSGMFLMGGSTFLFGCMSWSPGGPVFSILNFIIQVVSGVGFTLTSWAVLLLIGGGAFSFNSIYFLALIDSMAMMGLIGGAPFGTMIYSASGNSFFVPFALFGVILLGIGFSCIFAIGEDVEEVIDYPTSDDVQSFIRLPMVWVALISIFFNACADSFIFLTLTDELVTKKFTSVGIGGMFALTYLCTFSGDYLTGIITRKMKRNLTTSGSLLLTSAFFLVGPPFESLTSIIIALWLTLKGFGSGTLVSSSFAALMKIARFRMPDDLTTYLMVLKITNVVTYIGLTIGALCIGPFYYFFGRRLTTMIFAFIFLTITLITTFGQCFEKHRQRERLIEETPLCDCSLSHRHKVEYHQTTQGVLNSSLDQDSAEWGWLYGRNAGL